MQLNCLRGTNQLTGMRTSCRHAYQLQACADHAHELQACARGMIEDEDGYCYEWHEDAYCYLCQLSSVPSVISAIYGMCTPRECVCTRIESLCVQICPMLITVQPYTALKA